MSDLFTKLLLGLLVIALLLYVFVAANLIYCIITDSKRTTFSLKKDDWSCSLYHEYQTTTTIIVGEVVIPENVTNKECIQWSRK